MNYCNCPNCRTDNCPNAVDAEAQRGAAVRSSEWLGGLLRAGCAFGGCIFAIGFANNLEAEKWISVVVCWITSLMFWSVAFLGCDSPPNTVLSHTTKENDSPK